MTMKTDECYHGFRLLEERKIEEIGGIGRVFVHEQTKVTVVTLENKDPHKVFSINFKTIPDNNKGAAHIVEHTVCCASKKYPLKETFVALGQGSICTTMNACTYPDRTMYYAASPSEKDLLGILGVYLDLVFHPGIEEKSSFFLQEGWHYELEEKEAPLDISGVVYHEMLGEYGEAGAYLQYHELANMFPNSNYRFDAGGLPEEIIKLSEEEFLAFYHRYYVGSNAVITLYGDLDVLTFLKQMNEEDLYDIRIGEKIPMPAVQESFNKPKEAIVHYPSTLKNAPSIASLCFQVGGCTCAKERLSLEILEYMLLRSTASPLLKTLVMDQQLGVSLSDGGYDSCRMQPIFSITLKGVKKEKAKAFKEAVIEELEQLVREGIDPKLIDAAIETLEFELMENDDSYEPAGILYSEMIVTSLYGEGDVFAHLTYKKALEEIKEECHKGYFEALINKYFLENKHRALTMVLPSERVQKEKEAAKENFLKARKEAMGEEELKALIALNASLEAEQLEENSEAALETLPHLLLADLPDHLEELALITEKMKGCNVQIHEEPTKGISYFHFLWEAKSVPPEKWHVLGLLAHIFTYMGTRSKSYSEVENAINTYTGSMNVAIHSYQEEKTSLTKAIFKVSCKVLKRHLASFQALILELLLETQFNEKEKLREQIGHIVYELERSFTGAPEYRAVQRVYAYLSPEGRFEDEVAGYGFYQYIKEIYESFDICYASLAKELAEVLDLVINRSHLSVAVTCSKEDKEEVAHHLAAIIEGVPVKKVSKCYEINSWFMTNLLEGNEGFVNGQDGQAIAMGVNFKALGYTYKGQYEVVANILENTYLWDRVRLQGGAYGCDIMLTKEGYASVCSYCDPHLAETWDVFEKMGAYLRQLQLSEAVIERAVISTLGAMLIPVSMEQKSERACTYLITGATQRERAQIYGEIRQTTLEDFHEAAGLFEAIGKYGRTCVLGNDEVLREEKSRLTLIDLKI